MSSVDPCRAEIILDVIKTCLRFLYTGGEGNINTSSRKAMPHLMHVEYHSCPGNTKSQATTVIFT